MAATCTHAVSLWPLALNCARAIRSNSTAHYGNEIALIDAIDERVGNLTGLLPTMGHAAQVVASSTGLEPITTITECRYSYATHAHQGGSRTNKQYCSIIVIQ